MDIILDHKILDMSVVFTDKTTYSNPLRNSLAYILYLNNKKTTGDSPIIVPVIDRLADYEWTFTGLGRTRYFSNLKCI